MFTTVDRLSVLVACPRSALGRSAGSSSTGLFGVAEGWRTESPGETIRNYANSIARVNTIFETNRSGVLRLPQVVRSP
jgi:hypothetical protein